MSWIKENWLGVIALFFVVCFVALLIFNIVLVSTSKTKTFSTFNLQRFNVAGGGEQFVLEWESEGTHYEIMIKKE